MLTRMLFVGTAAAVCVASACTSTSPAKPNQTVAPGTQTGSATPNAGILEGLKKFPASTYHSIEEAAAAAGYAIPKPSIEYPLANNNTFLQGFPGAGVPISVSKYKLPQPSQYVEVDVGPASVWSGDATWTVGDKLTVGGKDGWLHTAAGTLFFAWRCGAARGETLWCIVFGGTEIGKENFLAFVATLS